MPPAGELGGYAKTPDTPVSFEVVPQTIHPLVCFCGPPLMYLEALLEMGRPLVSLGATRAYTFEAMPKTTQTLICFCGRTQNDSLAGLFLRPPADLLCAKNDLPAGLF